MKKKGAKNKELQTLNEQNNDIGQGKNAPRKVYLAICCWSRRTMFINLFIIQTSCQPRVMDPSSRKRISRKTEYEY